MNPEIKAQWVAALRSGEFEQGRSKLAQRESSQAVIKYCCLGVLCELAVRAGVGNRSAPTPIELDSDGCQILYYNGQEGFLPTEITTWAGLDDTNPRVLPVLPDDESRLTYLNDSQKKSFTEIADLIEASEI